MMGLSGILTAAAVFLWAAVVAFWSRRWSVWAVAVFSIVAFNLWKAAVEDGAIDMAVWVAAFACLTAIVAIVVLARRTTQ